MNSVVNIMSQSLKTTLTRDEWLNRVFLKSKSLNTKDVARSSLVVFDKFLAARYPNSTEQSIIEELTTYQDDRKYIFLQEYINFMDETDKSPQSIKNYFSFTKSYLRAKGVKTTQDDINQLLQFPKIRKEPKKALTIDEIKRMIDDSRPIRKALYMVLLSSGMRIGEVMALTKNDFKFDKNPVTVSLRAEITKTKEARTTYISEEAKNALWPLIEKMENDKLIFAKNQSPRYAVRNEAQVFDRLRNRLKFNEIYESKRHTITLHSFRSYFFTKANKKHGTDYANALVGHTGYLAQYYRLTDSEKARMYLELEPELTVNVEQKQQLEIERLEKENEGQTALGQKVKDLTAELEMMADKIKRIQDMNNQT